MGRAAGRILPYLSPSISCPMAGAVLFPAWGHTILQAIEAEQGFLWLLRRNSFSPSLAEGRNINPAGLNTRQVAGLCWGEHEALHSEPAAAATTVGVRELRCCLPKARGWGRRGLVRSRAATAFISIQVLRSREFDVSMAINLMKPTK